MIVTEHKVYLKSSFLIKILFPNCQKYCFSDFKAGSHFHREKSFKKDNILEKYQVSPRHPRMGILKCSDSIVLANTKNVATIKIPKWPSFKKDSK